MIALITSELHDGVYYDTVVGFSAVGKVGKVGTNNYCKGMRKQSVFLFATLHS